MLVLSSVGCRFGQPTQITINVGYFVYIPLAAFKLKMDSLSLRSTFDT